MATVVIPAALRELSGGRERVVVAGSTLRQVFDALERECPGIWARLVQGDDLLPGLAVIVDNDQASQGLIEPVGADSEVLILPALSGGSLQSLRDG